MLDARLARIARGAGALSLSLCLGCTQSGPPQPALELRWPEPPLETRIAHIRSIASPLDLEPEVSRWDLFVDFLFGRRTRIRGIRHPADVEVSPDGRTLYVSDFAQGIVHIFDLEERTVRYLGQPATLARPFGLALDAAGNLYIAEQAKRQIRVVSPSGSTLDIFRSDHLIRPTDVALDQKRGRLYVADPSHQDSLEHFVRVFDLDGKYLGEVGQGRGMAPGQLLFPTYVTLDSDGNVYVADTMNARISVFDPSGNFLRIIGSRGDGFGRFDKPKGIAFDSFGNLYVVDSSWSNVQIFGPGGDVLLYFGGRGGYPGLLRNPTGVAISRQQNRIFVADYLNHRVSVYQLMNTKPGDGIPQQEKGGPP